MNWTIKEGTKENIDDIAQFQVAMAAESEGTALDLTIVTKGVSLAVEDPAKGSYFLACTADGTVAGSLFLTKEWSDWHATWYWWVQSVYVRPQFRQQGAYRALYQHVRKLAKEAGITSLRLYVDRDNERAKKTYHAQGMSESHYLMFEEEL